MSDFENKTGKTFKNWAETIDVQTEVLLSS